MRSKILGAARLALLSVVLLLASASVSAVSDSDICFLQPVDQCSGGQFAELGSTDGDTTGKDYLFESSITNGNTGDAVLQHKDSSSTTFTDLYTSTYFSDFGSSSSVFWQKDQSVTIKEGNSKTITVNSNEHTIQAEFLDAGTDDADTVLDGSDLGDIPAGDTFQIEGLPTQVSKVFIGEEVSQQNQIAVGEWWNFTIDGESHEIYLNSVNDETTISAKVDGTLANYNEHENFTLSGKKVEVSDVIYLGGSDGETEFTVYNDVEKATYTVFNKLTSPEGYNEYRVKWMESGSPQSWSDSLFFSVDKAQNIPADKQVSINDQVVDQPRTLTGVTPNSNINVTVFQDAEQDPVNVTLYTSGGTKVSTISQGDSYGAFRSVYDDISDDLLATFRSGSNQTFVFPTSSSSLLSQQGTTYDFYFEIKDKGEAGNPVRTTKMYAVETSGTATNQPPNVSSIEAFTLESGSWKPIDNVSFGESIDAVRADVNDPDNEFLTAELYLEQEHDGVVHFNNSSYDENVGDTYTWNVNGSFDVVDSGDWTAQVYADDGSNNVSEERNWNYSFSQPNITSSYSQTEVERYQEFNATLNVSCPQYECVNENESMKIFLDPINQEVVVKVGERNYRYDYNNVFSKSEPTVFSLEYWQSWITEVVQQV